MIFSTFLRLSIFAASLVIFTTHVQAQETPICVEYTGKSSDITYANIHELAKDEVMSDWATKDDGGEFKIQLAPTAMDGNILKLRHTRWRGKKNKQFFFVISTTLNKDFWWWLDDSSQCQFARPPFRYSDITGVKIHKRTY